MKSQAIVGQRRPKPRLTKGDVLGRPLAETRASGLYLRPKSGEHRTQRLNFRSSSTILLEDKKAKWRVLGSDGRYRLLKPSGGFLKSKIFPGLWLDTGALFPPDRKRLLAGVEAG